LKDIFSILLTLTETFLILAEHSRPGRNIRDQFDLILVIDNLSISIPFNARSVSNLFVRNIDRIDSRDRSISLEAIRE